MTKTKNAGSAGKASVNEKKKTGTNRTEECMNKPREIFLCSSYVEGLDEEGMCPVPESLKEGDRLILKREKSQFEDDEIYVIAHLENLEKFGRVAEIDSKIPARLMDAGKVVTAKVSRIGSQDWLGHIGIELYLAD